MITMRMMFDVLAIITMMVLMIWQKMRRLDLSKMRKELTESFSKSMKTAHKVFMQNLINFARKKLFKVLIPFLS